MTATQQQILAVLTDQPMTPTQIAKLVPDLHGNAGAAAASLRVLVRLGLVEQSRVLPSGRWPLFAYRKAE
jgi:hypothetical protein